MTTPTLALLLVLPVHGFVLEETEFNSMCTPRMVRERMGACTPLLSSIANQILASDGRNFSAVCREFIKFTFCVEKDLYGCHPLLLRRYRTIKLKYMRPPYYCKDPFLDTTPKFGSVNAKLTGAQRLLSLQHQTEAHGDDVIHKQTTAGGEHSPEQRTMYLRTVSLMLKSMIRRLVG